MPKARTDPEARFWGKVDQSAGPDGCWPWRGAFNRPSAVFKQKHRGGQSRRPVFNVASKCTVYAHRYALSLTDGVPLFDRGGLECCHKKPGVCTLGDACVNPAHLYWGTPDENRADRYGARSRALLERLG